MGTAGRYFTNKECKIAAKRQPGAVILFDEHSNSGGINKIMAYRFLGAAIPSSHGVGIADGLTRFRFF